MTCAFHRRFKKWTPVAVVDKRTRLVMIDRLSKDIQYNRQTPRPNDNRGVSDYGRYRTNERQPRHFRGSTSTPDTTRPNNTRPRKYIHNI
jgi:hypothetical protein